MTEETGQETRHENEKSLRERLEQMSVGKIAWLIVRLIGLLLLTFLKYLLRLVVRSVVYAYEGVKKTCKRIKVFWNSNSTQEKIRWPLVLEMDPQGIAEDAQGHIDRHHIHM